MQYWGEGIKLSIKRSALYIFLVVILGSVLFISSCLPSQQGLVTIPSSEQDGQPPDEPAVEEPPTDLSYLIERNPAEVDNSELPLTPVEDLHLTGLKPKVDIEQYRLVVDGLVDKELALTYEEILNYPTVTSVVLLICPYFFADNAEWTGIPVTTLLAEAGIKPEASVVEFYSLDGHYTKTFFLEEIQDNGVFLAHTVNGQILPAEHGFPLRLVVTGEYGSLWVKWVDRIEVR